MTLRQLRFDQSGSVACAYPLAQSFCFEIRWEIYQNMRGAPCRFFCLVTWEVPDGCKQSPNFYLRWPGG